LKLGDAFPPDLRKATIISNLRKGLVSRDFREEISHPKIKIFILAGLDLRRMDAKLVLINSEIVKFAQNRPALRERHIEIGQAEYSFLRHTSYIDCTYVVTTPFRKLTNRLLSGKAEILGHLSEPHLERLVEEVERASTVRGRDKEVITQSLCVYSDYVPADE